MRFHGYAGMQRLVSAPRTRSRQGISHSASRLGAAIAPPLVVAIMIHFGWRPGVLHLRRARHRVVHFVVFPATAICRRAAWAAAGTGIYPRRRRKGQRQADRLEEHSTLPWKVLLASPNMWAIMCALLHLVYCLWIFLSWLPSYLWSTGISGSLRSASTPPCRCLPASLATPLAADNRLAAGKTGEYQVLAKACSHHGPARLRCVFIVPAAMSQSATTAVLLPHGAMFFLECTDRAVLAVPMHVGGEYSGTVSGMMNMAGNIGGALSPIVFGILVQYGSWVAPFIVAGALPVFGELAWALPVESREVLVDQSLIGKQIATQIACVKHRRLSWT